MSIENPTDSEIDGSLRSGSRPGFEPFKQTPDPRLFYTSPQQLNTYSLLFSSIHDRKGLILLTGEPGIGKTLLLRRMVTDLEGSGCKVFYFCNPPSSTEALWRTCCEQVGLELAEQDAASYRAALIRFMENDGEVAALLLDEADGLPSEVLEDIAEVSSRGRDGAKLLQTILASQPKFASKLLTMRLSETCTLHAELDPIPEREVAPFIRHQLLAAGWVEEWFSKEAIARISHYSQGLPARINSLCREAMFIAQLESVPSISGKMIDLVASDQGLDKPIVKEARVGRASSEDETLAVDRSVSSGNRSAATDEPSNALFSREIGDAKPSIQGNKSWREYPDDIVIDPEFFEDDESPPAINQHAPKDSMDSPSLVPEGEGEIDPRSLVLDERVVPSRHPVRRGRSRASSLLVAFLLIAVVILFAWPSGPFPPIHAAWESLLRTVPQLHAFRSVVLDGVHDAIVSGEADSTASSDSASSDSETQTALLTGDESDLGSASGTRVDPIPNEATQGQLEFMSDTQRSPPVNQLEPTESAVYEDRGDVWREPVPIPSEHMEVTESGTSSVVMDGLSEPVVEDEALESAVAGKRDALPEDLPYGSPALRTRDTMGAEDTAIALDISVTSGTDEQVLWVEVEGLPDGAELSSGAEADGVWVLAWEDLPELTVTPSENSDEDFSIVARLVDSERKELAQETLDVRVHAVADEPRLDARAADGDQYTAIPIEISTGLMDDDGSETLEIKISGVPISAELSAGRNDGNGVWSLTSRDLRGLILTPLDNSPPEIKLTVTAIATESSNQESSKIRKVLRFDVILSESSTS